MELMVLGVSLLLLLLATASLHGELRRRFRVAKQQQAQLLAILHERADFIGRLNGENSLYFSEEQRSLLENLKQSQLRLSQSHEDQERSHLSSEISTRLGLVAAMLSDFGGQPLTQQLIELKIQLEQLEERCAYACQCYNDAAQSFNDIFHHPLALLIVRLEGYRAFILF
jgi:hypothetical protein